MVLLADAKPVKTRPYRYPHSQKEQIEIMVQEMLDQGIIQPSIAWSRRRMATGYFAQTTEP